MKYSFVVVSGLDGEAPPDQSREFWHALRTEGVITQLVVYPNEGHHFVDPHNRRDMLERAKLVRAIHASAIAD